MSSVIDERVVQMSFDNDQFEKGVSQTIKSLNKLDKTLVDTADGEYFTKMEERISKVEQAFTKSGMVINGVLIGIGQTINQYINKGLAALTQGIRGGFAEYETQMGATQTILANVKDEGKGIADVTAALDELNTYADKTIYNFTEMTRNIGMFTAAGANLDTSVATIKGLANAAALVGANATTAARAWYQVSQAMAAGSFKLMDWRSLEISNIAGEGFKSVITEVARKDGVAIDDMIKRYGSLRDTLRDGWLTADRFAEAMRILSGDLDEDAIKALGYTDEQAAKLHDLAEEAVYAATKVKTFSQLMETTAEAIGSGWAVTFRNIIGDFEKARDFYTRISTTINGVIDKISDYRNRLISYVWNTDGYDGKGSAYNNIKDTLDNILAIFSTFVGAVRAGFDNVFPFNDIKENLIKFTNFANKTTKALTLNTYKSVSLGHEKVANEEAEIEKDVQNITDAANDWDLDAINDNIVNLIRVFRGLFSGIDLIFRTVGDGIEFVISLIPGVDDFYTNLKNGNTNLIGNLATIMDNVTKFRDIVVKMKLVPRILNLIKQEIIKIIKTNPLAQAVINTIAYAIALVKTLIQTISKIDINPLNVILGMAKLIGGAFIGLASLIGQAIGKVIEFFNGATGGDFFKDLGEEVYKFIKILDELGKGTISVADVFDYYKAKVIKAFESIMRSPFVEGFIKFFITAKNTIETFWENVVTNFENAKTVIASFFDQLDIDWKSIGVFGVLAAIGVLLYKWFTDIEGIVGLAKRFGEVLQAYANKENSEALLNVAYAVGILAAALFALSWVPYQQLLDASAMLIATLFMFIMLSAVLEKTFDALEAVKTAVKPVEKMFLNLTIGLKKFLARSGTAILLEAVGDALIKIAIAIVGMAAAFEFMPKSMEKAIVVLTSLGAALAILVTVLSYFTGKANSLKGFKGFIEAGKLLHLGITNFLDSLSQSIRIVTISIMIEAFADAIVKLAAAFAIISYVVDDSDKWIKSLVSLGTIIVLMAGVIYVMSQSVTTVAIGTLFGFSLMMTVFGTAVAALSGVAYLMGQVDWNTLAKGVGSVMAITVSLGIMMAVMVSTVSVGFAPIAGIALIFVALGTALAAIISTASLIQNETQTNALIASLIGMFFIIGAISGLAALLGSLSGLNPTLILSLAGIIVSMAALFVAMGFMFEKIDNVRINDNTMWTLLGMLAAVGLITGIIGALALAIGIASETNIMVGVISILAVLGMFLGITAWSFLALSLAELLLNISQATLNVEEALVNFYDMLHYMATYGEEMVMTFYGSALTLLTIIPSFFPLFVEIGIAFGTAVTGFLLGFQMMIEGIVLQVCTMLLRIIAQVADWINSNADLIQSVIIKVFRAIMNIGIIALNVVLHEALPRLLGLLIQFAAEIFSVWNSLLITMFADLFLEFSKFIEPYNEDVAKFFNDLGLAFKLTADLIKVVCEKIIEYISGVVDGITKLDNTIRTITGTAEEDVEEFNNVIGDGAANFMATVEALKAGAENGGKVILEKNDEIIKSEKKVQDTSTETAEKMGKNSKAVVDRKAEEAEEYNKYTNSETQTQIDGAKIIEDVLNGNWENIINTFTAGFSTNLENQMEYINSMINNEEYLGEQLNNSTAITLTKNKDLYAEFYGGLSREAVQFHKGLSDFSNAVLTGPKDQASLKKANEDYLVPAYNAAKKIMDESDKTMKDILLGNDGLYLGVATHTKSLMSGTFDTWESVMNDFTDMWNSYSVDDVNTNAYSPKYGSGSGFTNTDALQDELKKRNDIVGKADSEIQPKDLTPTIDLDSLKNEVNQANSIMTGSLLAAQNAAIGNYINTDSELNPFLKDRWQNVYNFTQNNYSPKALSRIDIYRQTQNQLRLSRGM